MAHPLGLFNQSGNTSSFTASIFLAQMMVNTCPLLYTLAIRVVYSFGIRLCEMCEVTKYMWLNLGKPFQIAHQAKSNEHHQHIATPLYYNRFQPKLWSTYSRLIIEGVNSWWCKRLEWRLHAGTGKCLGWLYPVLLLLLVAQMSSL